MADNFTVLKCSLNTNPRFVSFRLLDMLLALGDLGLLVYFFEAYCNVVDGFKDLWGYLDTEADFGAALD